MYTSHTENLTPQQTAFEHLAACLSVVFELLPVFCHLQYCDKMGQYGKSKIGKKFYQKFAHLGAILSHIVVG